MMLLTRKLRKFADSLFYINRIDINILLCIIFATMLGIFMFGENIRAQWWIIDDHEIAYFLGGDHVLGIKEIPNKLMNGTEIGQYLHYSRFRPVYYLFRLWETSIWGDQPGMWYVFRIAVFGLFVGSFWYLISKSIGNMVIGGFLSFYAATSKYWVDIIGRLGPSEIYGVLGLMFFGFGIYIMYKSNRITGWWGMFVGIVICSGSKENFLFLFLPLIYIIWSFYKKGKLNITRMALAFSSFVWMAWIGYTVFVSARSSGSDVYSNPVGITDRLLIMISLFKRFDFILLLLVCVFLLFLKQLFHIENSEILAYSKEAGMKTLILTIIYISQMFFYSGDWPIGTRYDFPGLLVWPLLFVVIISFFQKIAQTYRVKMYEVNLMLLSTLATFILAFSQLRNIHQAQLSGEKNVARTTTFTAQMKELAEVSTQNPDYVLIIETDNPAWDYEPVFSYVRFLRFYGTKNKISFLWAGRKPENYSNNLNSSLAKDLSDLSIFGKEPAGLVGKGNDFIPFSEVDGYGTKCILIVISGQPKKDCPQIIMSNWR